ncbi:MAG: hypothetical protein IT257_03380 [Chitinophagaceae bacterium]|nr:hypothetical protein [Chitinophagaceae bacterium]
MKRVFKIIVIVLISVLTILLIIVNVRLLTAVDLNNRAAVKKNVLQQLHYLEQQLKQADLAHRMQQQYPEGFVFVHALYGLTWCAIARFEDTHSAVFLKAVAEATNALHEIESEQGRRNFDQQLLPSYGIFYRGWHNYLWGKLLALQTASDQHDELRYETNCRQIAQALFRDGSPYPESYRHAVWPADAFVAVASLRMHDRLFVPQYDSLIASWIVKVQGRLDPFTGLIPHEVASASCNVLQGARGSSMSLILIFLTEIDSLFANRQMQHYKKFFLMHPMGLHAIREYPKGKQGTGDIDSGPVIMGMSLAGSITSVGCLLRQGERSLACGISSAIECFGLAYQSGADKKYLLGAFPIADLFIAWTQLQEGASNSSRFLPLTGSDSHLYFYLISLVLLSMFGFLVKKCLPF